MAMCLFRNQRFLLRVAMDSAAANVDRARVELHDFSVWKRGLQNIAGLFVERFPRFWAARFPIFLADDHAI